MKKQLSERELIELQIQAYEFYAGLIDRAVGGGSHEAHLPRWDEQRALEYRQLADQLRRRLAELDAQTADAPATTPVPIPAEAEPAVPFVVAEPAVPFAVAESAPASGTQAAEPEPEAAVVGEPGGNTAPK